MRILWISAAVRVLYLACRFLEHDTTGDATQRSMLDKGSRNGQAKWNIRSDTALRRESVGLVTNYRVRNGEAWRCLYPAGILTCMWYRMPLWIKLETEHPIMSYIIDLEQPREGWRCHDGIYMPMYEKIRIIRNMVYIKRTLCKCANI